MRLAAVYMPSGVLPYIFGEDHEGFTINFGGKYSYELKDNGFTFVISNRFKNSNYINGFWGGKIDSVSAIVGKNGTGKSSLLEVFRDRSFCKYIIEDENGENPEIWDNTIGHFDILYYTPFLNIKNIDYEHDNFYDFSKYALMLDDSGHENLSLAALLELHNSENIKRWIKFRNLPHIEEYLERINLPIFERIQVKINSMTVDDHDTSYAFRPFFESFKKIRREEIGKRYLELESKKGKPITSLEEKYFNNQNNLELYIIQGVINKVHKILESSGNKYLGEGYIESKLTVESDEYKKRENLKESFYWFLDNAYVQLSKESEKIKLPTEEIKVLIELLIQNLPDDDDIENWSEYYIDLDKSINVINAYEKFIKSFQTDFTYDRKTLLIFRPDINLSSGEKSMYNLFSSCYDNQYKVKNGLQSTNHLFNKNKDVSDKCILLFDEPEMGFHPQWKRNFVNSILTVLPIVFEGKQLQIIFTTHDPLTLSDIPINNVTFLARNEETRNSFIVDHMGNQDLSTFGANVHDLLAHSFFLEDGFMGEFAEGMIKSLIDHLTEEDDRSLNSFNHLDWSKETILRFINTVDEPFIKERLKNLYDEKYFLNDKQALQDKRDEIDARLNEMKDEED